ncbi:MAG: sigma factor-like helix-turn-helix DNA-binding protein, partial [Humidesulfovibrio sp.]|nr:sigma factor-like helix-turn-helix DNA-binding protein [Humidesulfovibrio sp.]
REIGDRFGVTRERERQIEARLLEKLKEHLSSRVKDFSADWIESEE